MKQAMLLVLIGSLMLPACAPALATRSPGQADVWRRHVEHLPIGSVVRVRTTSGDRFTAVLLAADDTAIDVARKTRVPEPIRRVPFGEIARLELDRNGAGAMVAKAAAIGAGVGAGTFFSLLLLMAAVWD